MSDETISTIIKLFLSSLVIIVPATAYFIADWFKMRTKYNDLKLRMDAVEIDDTERTRKLSAEAQELIQKVYGQQVEELRHQRDLIDQANTNNAVLQQDNNRLNQQQQRNVEQIAELKEQVKALHDAEIERDKLKQVVADLTKQVNEYEAKAEERHKDMSVITATNFELNLKLKAMTVEFRHAYQLLKDCYQMSGSPVPDFATLVESDKPIGLSDKKEKSNE